MRPLSLSSKIVCGRQGHKTPYNCVSRLRAIVKLQTYDGLDGCNFIFQSVCKLFNCHLAKFLFVFKSLRQLAIAVCRPYNKQTGKKVDKQTDCLCKCQDMQGHKRPPCKYAAQYGDIYASTRSPNEGSNQHGGIVSRKVLRVFADKPNSPVQESGHNDAKCCKRICRSRAGGKAPLLNAKICSRGPAMLTAFLRSRTHTKPQISAAWRIIKPWTSNVPKQSSQS